MSMTSTGNARGGVTGHSAPSHWLAYVLFAIDNPKLETHFLELCSFHNIPVTKLRGSWEGVEEDSYCVPFKDLKKNMNAILPFIEGQDCVMIIDRPETRSRAWRDAYLVYLDIENPAYGEMAVRLGDRYYPLYRIGNFKQVPERIAMSRDGWTYNPNNKAFFICEKSTQEYTL